jgi:Rac GTPase-activating protein 1
VIKKRRRSALQKAVELNSSDRIVATTTVTMPKEGTITASSVIEAIPADENKDPQQNSSAQSSSRKRRKSGERGSKSKSHQDQDITPTVRSLKIVALSSPYHTQPHNYALL